MASSASGYFEPCLHHVTEQACQSALNLIKVYLLIVVLLNASQIKPKMQYQLIFSNYNVNQLYSYQESK